MAKQPAKQTTLETAIEKGGETSKFNEIYCRDLCKALVASRIPLFVLRSLAFRNFLEKYTHIKTPSESLIRKVYLDREIEEDMRRMQESLSKEYLWVQMDETTDSSGRYILNVLAGALHADKSSTPFLILTEELEKVNNTTVAQVYSSICN